MRAGQKYFWPALFALERGRRGINVDYCETIPYFV